MWGKAAFFKHLKNELPSWIEKGWVSAADSEALLGHYETGKERVSMVSAAFGVLGVMLLLSGIITFFAANWSEMTKLAKLVLLFGGMLGAYGLAIKPFSHEKYPRMWASMLLLAVGMFGANIMLLAQIYHIDSHYPNGVLLWALGALLLAWLVPAQAVMVMSLVLGLLWTSMEIFGFNNYHFTFLLFLAVALPRIALQGWRCAMHVAAVALLGWTLFVYIESWDYSNPNARLLVTELMFVAYLALFVLGLLMAQWARVRAWGQLVQRYAVLASLGFFYLLTSPYIHSGQNAWWRAQVDREAFDTRSVVFVLIALAVLVALAVWHHVLTRHTVRAKFLDWARWLIAACVALLVGTLVIGGGAGGAVAMAFNLFYFAGLVWLVAAGVHMNDRVLVNLAFVFFAITLVTRYFDTFWTLMNRSFFFMAGGVLLLVIGYLLENQRRNFTGRIQQQKAAAATGSEA